MSNIKLGGCDDIIFAGLKYASEKAKKRKQRILKKVKIEELPLLQEGIGAIMDNIQHEEMIERSYFQDLKN